MSGWRRVEAACEWESVTPTVTPKGKPARNFGMTYITQKLQLLLRRGDFSTGGSYRSLRQRGRTRTVAVFVSNFGVLNCEVTAVC